MFTWMSCGFSSHPEGPTPGTIPKILCWVPRGKLAGGGTAQKGQGAASSRRRGCASSQTDCSRLPAPRNRSRRRRRGRRRRPTPCVRWLCAMECVMECVMECARKECARECAIEGSWQRKPENQTISMLLEVKDTGTNWHNKNAIKCNQMQYSRDSPSGRRA